MADIEIPDPWPLRTIDTPAEVDAVAGCDCGGLEWHEQHCSIWRVPYEQAQAAVDAAKARGRAFTAGLNARLRAEHPELFGDAR